MTTEKGIYYPTDYSDVADIPADMKEMAESIDDALTSSDGEIEGIKEEQLTQNTQINNNKTDIEAIKTEQTEQNTDIQANTENITALLEKIDYIEGLIPTGEASGESLTLSNTARYPFKEFNVGGNTKQATAILPDEYQQVDYIESSGTQYIDTGFKPNQDTRCIVDMMYTGSTSGWIIGARTSNTASDKYGLLKSSSDGENIVRTDYFNTQANISGIYLNTRYVIDKNKNVVRVDGTWKNSAVYNNFQTAYNLFIFGLGTTEGTTFAPGILRLYNCKIYDNDTLVRNFIPCYRKSDNVVGLYDLVNNVFYTNAGTGAFTYGAAVTLPNPDYPIPVENVSGEVEVKVENKNQLDIDNLTFKNGYYNAQGQWSAGNNNGIIEFIDVLPNTQYTLSTNRKIYLIAISEFNQTSFVKRAQSSNVTSVTFTTDSNTNKLAIVFNLDGSTTMTKALIESWQPQLEQGSTATSYEPHEEQTATFPLAEGQVLHLGDTLEDDGIHQKYEEIEFDGSVDENWTINGNNQGYGIVISNVGGNADSTKLSNILCNKLIPTEQNDIYYGLKNNCVASIGGNVNKLYIRYDSSITSVEILRNVLQSSPIKIQYELKNEIIIPYTAEQQTAYNNLKNLYSYKGTTHISSSNEPSPVFEVVYRKELESIANS